MEVTGPVLGRCLPPDPARLPGTSRLPLCPHLLRDPLAPEVQSLPVQILLSGRNGLVSAKEGRGLTEGMANFFCKEPGSTYFSICEPH